MFTDVFSLTGTNSAVRFHSKRGATIYYYCFDYHGSNSFISLFMNATDDIGKCLQFVGHVKYLQWAVRGTHIFVSFRNTKLSKCATAHAHTQY